MKVTFWCHIRDNGDGSASPLLFPTEVAAEQSAENEMEFSGQALCDNVVERTIEIKDDGTVTTDDEDYWEDLV